MQPQLEENSIAVSNVAIKKLSLANAHEEALQFRELQKGLVEQFEKYFPDKQAPKTVVIIPSLTMDAEILSNKPS